MISSALVPGAHRDRVLRAVMRGEPLLELAADRAERELAGGQCARRSAEDLGAVFGREVDPGRGTDRAGVAAPAAALEAVIVWLDSSWLGLRDRRCRRHRYACGEQGI